MTLARAPNAYFTIGHAARSVENFVGLLTPVGIKLVVDVRKFPQSRKNPQFDSNDLSAALRKFEIDYEHLASLGGRRGKSNLPEELNAFWQNQSFHNYADYATTTDFQDGFIRLRDLGHATTCVVMCAETVWWRCHRRIISDYLLASGESVFHILAPGHIEPAHLTAGANIGPHGSVVYRQLANQYQAERLPENTN